MDYILVALVVINFLCLLVLWRIKSSAGDDQRWELIVQILMDIRHQTEIDGAQLRSREDLSKVVESARLIQDSAFKIELATATAQGKLDSIYRILSEIKGLVTSIVKTLERDDTHPIQIALWQIDNALRSIDSNTRGD